MHGLFQNGSLSEVCSELSSLRTDESCMFLSPLGIRAQYIMLKFADGLTHRHPGIEFHDINPLDLIHTFSRLVEGDLTDMFSQIDSFRIHEDHDIVGSIHLLLRMFEVILSPGMGLVKIPSESSKCLSETLVGISLVDVTNLMNFWAFYATTFPSGGCQIRKLRQRTSYRPGSWSCFKE